jgi:hypothetical protein
MDNIPITYWRAGWWHIQKWWRLAKWHNNTKPIKLAMLYHTLIGNAKDCAIRICLSILIIREGFIAEAIGKAILADMVGEFKSLTCRSSTQETFLFYNIMTHVTAPT